MGANSVVTKGSQRLPLKHRAWIICNAPMGLNAYQVELVGDVHSLFPHARLESVLYQDDALIVVPEPSQPISPQIVAHTRPKVQRIYHFHPECPIYPSQKNQRTFRSVEEAKADGYTACSQCLATARKMYYAIAHLDGQYFDHLTKELLLVYRQLDKDAKQTLLNLAKMIKTADEPRIIGSS